MAADDGTTKVMLGDTSPILFNSLLPTSEHKSPALRTKIEGGGGMCDGYLRAASAFAFSEFISKSHVHGGYDIDGR